MRTNSTLIFANAYFWFNHLVQLTDGDPAKAAAERRCEPGFFCVGGIKALCDPGTWGGEFGLVSFLGPVILLCIWILICCCVVQCSLFIVTMLTSFHCICQTGNVYSITPTVRACVRLDSTAHRGAYPPLRSTAGMRTSTAPGAISSPCMSQRGTFPRVSAPCWG